MMKNVFKIAKKQRGQALILAMVMLAIGSIMLTPLIGLVTTSLNVGRHTEIQVDDYYAADAGVEIAIWYIRQESPDYTKVPELIYDPLNPGVGGVTSFQITGVNGQTLDVVVTRTKSREFRVESSINPSGTEVIAYIVQGNYNIFDAALASSGDVDIKKDSYIDGPIYSGGEIELDEPNTHDNSEDLKNDNTLTFPSTTANAEFAQQFKEEAIDGGTHNGNLNISTNSSIGPLYITGNLTTAKDITVTLIGDIYVEGTITINDNTEITGSGSIVAVGDISFDKLGNFGSPGVANTIYSVNGNIEFRKAVGSVGPDDQVGTTDDTPMYALIYAPNGSVTFKKAATIVGSVICGHDVNVPDNITADKDFTITYDSIYKDTMELPGFNPSEIRTWTITSK